MKFYFQSAKNYIGIKYYLYLRFCNFNMKKSLLKFLKNNSKLLTLNILATLTLIHYNKFYSLNVNKLHCSSREFPFLLNLNSDKDYESKFSKRKCPKIIYLVSKRESTDEITTIESDFQKIHSKYKDLESYALDIKNIPRLESLLKMYGSSLEEFVENVDLLDDKNINLIKETLLKKPFIFINKYGDIKNYSVKEFRDIAKSESVYNYFERLSVLNNKNDLLILNEYDYALVAYLDGNKIDYSQPNFKIFRRIYFLLNFFNIKFFVATKEHTPFLNLVENNIYMIKRKNLISNKGELVKLENEDYEILNLTGDLKDLNRDNDDSKYHITFKLFIFR